MKKTIYFNGKVITVNDKSEVAEAILVEGGNIAKVGTNEEILAFKSDDTELVDLEGKTMMPGLIDPHGHVVAMSQVLMLVQLGDVTSREQIVERLKEYYATTDLPEGAWIIGFGYDNSKFEDKEHPTKFDLDQVTNEVPITITHASGHIAVVNSPGLELYGYGGIDYVVPDGGVVGTVSEDSRESNGVLEENAILATEKKTVIKAPTFEQVLGSLVKAQKLYASLGITTTMDASVEEGNHYNDMMLALAQSGKTIIDIVGLATQFSTFNMMKNEGTPKREYYNHYKLAGAKTWLDGSPQGKTAWLSTPYHVVPEGQPADYCGYGTQPDDVMVEYFTKCIENNLQVHVHTNGDMACDQFFRCYSKALEITGSTADLRPVMVHCQALRLDQLDKVKELGAIPTFFNDHVAFWGDYHYDSVFGPEKSQNISPIGSALEKGILFTLHQDPPVKVPNQILGIHNAVNRTTESGRVLGEHQRISVMDAIKAVTINGAYQYFEEDIKGSIEEGKLADLIIVDKNPLEIPKEEIKNVVVLETIKEGNTIFKR
ncbi:MAG: amidohydrolase [Terrisporobacter sp.]|uniref:amidohydrolase n=1 Tax=Terrisporobacter sp. TaxID=1965305 RepID=UPI002FCC74A4